MDKLQAKNLKVKNGFLRLTQGVSRFRTGLEDDVKKEEEKLAAGIAEIKKQIARLEEDLTA